jgi:ubiquinone/menaquinone biosynthesis C-methylase UbiE
MEDKLLQYYLALRHPEANEWNSSPPCLYTEMMTRDYVSKNFSLADGIQVCNVGIGTGDWDDYLGYWLKGRGSLTSLDIDKEICELFEYRQHRERHTNPSKVICASIFDPELPAAAFDIVTLIGSTVNEAGHMERCLDSCFRLLRDGGYLMFMANLNSVSVDKAEHYVGTTCHRIEQMDTYELFPQYPFFICKLKK